MLEMSAPETHSERTPDAASTDLDMTRTQFASWARQLIKLITNLRALGAQADFDLPRIAVIGNQSAGKSSLVEAISGISVPRAHGTCTRCPMECRLTSTDAPWQCQVLLRQTDTTGGTKETKFGPVLDDRSLLGEMIRRAQLAILNPGLPASHFENFDTSSLPVGAKPEDSPKQLAFSSNVVCLDLSGPDLPDLSFIDLPGIISTVDKGEDKRNIDAVKEMVQDHIKGNTFILLTITMRDDINNQGAAHLAQLEDITGSRTIGVLTKPDTIQEGEEDGWLKILAGKGSGHELTHGYFITKHPSPKELEEQISHNEARDREAKFFDSTPPWALKAELRSRMGTPNLTRELSNLLGALISRSIPGLRQEAQLSLDAVKQSLERLPAPPSEDPQIELLGMINDLSNVVKALVVGSEGSEKLLQKCRPAHQKFKSNILSTSPDFRPFKSAKEDPKMFKPMFGGGGTGVKEQPSSQTAMYLEDVKGRIDGSLTRELPFNTPFSVKVEFIKRFTKDWESHCNECFDAIYEVTKQELRALAQDRFGGYASTTLLADVSMLCDDLVEKHRTGTLERIKFQLELEDSPFTLNEHYFTSGRAKYLAQYKETRNSKATFGTTAAPAGDQVAMQEALAALARIGINAVPEDLAKLHKDDHYEQELTVMAETAAYFRVAYKRIIDDIPRVIDSGFLRAIAKDLYSAVVSGLLISGEKGSQRAAQYLAEDHQVKAERRHLMQKKERLEAAMRELRKFQILAGPENEGDPSRTVASSPTTSKGPVAGLHTRLDPKSASSSAGNPTVPAALSTSSAATGSAAAGFPFPAAAIDVARQASTGVPDRSESSSAPTGTSTLTAFTSKDKFEWGVPKPTSTPQAPLPFSLTFGTEKNQQANQSAPGLQGFHGFSFSPAPSTPTKPTSGLFGSGTAPSATTPAAVPAKSPFSDFSLATEKKPTSAGLFGSTQPASTAKHTNAAAPVPAPSSGLGSAASNEPATVSGQSGAGSVATPAGGFGGFGKPSGSGPAHAEKPRPTDSSGPTSSR